MSQERGSYLDEMKYTLDREAVEIDKAKSTLTTGSRLLKEKQVKIRELEKSLAENNQVLCPVPCLYLLVRVEKIFTCCSICSV